MRNKQPPRHIVFLAVNSSYSHTNLAALYLQAFTADMGFDWTTVEVVATEDFHPALHRIVQLKPTVLAATFYLFNRKAALSILQRYRLLNPKCRIFAGGPEFLGDNRDLLTSERCIDAAIRGEGENAFRQLLTNVDHPERWPGIPGLCGIVDGQYVDNGMAEEVRNLDDNPSPYEIYPPILGGLPCGSPLGSGNHAPAGCAVTKVEREQRETATHPPILGGLSCGSPLGNGRQTPNGCDIMEAERDQRAAATNPPILGGLSCGSPLGSRNPAPQLILQSLGEISVSRKPKPFIQLETSRGCRNKCSFCTSGASGAVRCFSIHRVRSDLKLIRKTGVRNVRIVDRTFNENRSRCVELIRMFREEFGDMAFHLEIDPALIGDEVLREMGGRGRHAVVPPILGGLSCGSPLGSGNRTPVDCAVTRVEQEQRASATHPPILGGLSCCSPLGNGKNAAPGETGRHGPTLHLDVGVQTFGAKVLKLAGRRGGSTNTVRGLKALCGLGGVAVHADLIAGLPGATLAQTFKDLRKLVAMRPAEIQLELLKLLPGTRLSKERKTFGIIAAPDTPYEVLKTRDMTAEDVHAARMLCKLVDWFYEPVALREVVWQANDTMPGFWQELVAFCAAGAGPWTTPSLENRFRLMDEFLAGCLAQSSPRARRERETKRSAFSARDLCTGLQQALRYAWMKYGLSVNGGICEVRPWKEPVPADAVLVEGDAGAEICRMFAAVIGPTYIFAYGRTDVDRKAVAVWKRNVERGT